MFKAFIFISHFLDIHKEQEKNDKKHCVKSVRIRSFSGPYFPAFGLNTDQNNSEYEHFLRSEMPYFL